MWLCRCAGSVAQHAGASHSVSCRALAVTTTRASTGLLGRHNGPASTGLFTRGLCVTATGLPPLDTFERRHNGIANEAPLLKAVGCSDLDDVVYQTVPDSILMQRPLEMTPAMGEREALEHLRGLASMNKVYRSFIGMGFHHAVVPTVILRNILENPGWYTQYTPYQAEISQGRMEMLMNYQTMVKDLTGMMLANSSLLDEATAAGEAMGMCYSHCKQRRHTFLLDDRLHPQNIALLQARAVPFGINLKISPRSEFEFNKDVCGAVIQYPDTDGTVEEDLQAISDAAHANGALMCVAADILALTMLKPPGELGADIAFGNSQRFGVPIGLGGPHAAFFAVNTLKVVRKVPGRIIGVSKDADGKPAYRLTLQTREQHIKRGKATSNICTAQALLANISGAYAVYHGPKGIKDVALRVRDSTATLAKQVELSGFELGTGAHYFDTVKVNTGDLTTDVRRVAEEQKINLRFFGDEAVSFTIDETVEAHDILTITNIFRAAKGLPLLDTCPEVEPAPEYPPHLKRNSEFLTHAAFNSHHTETQMLRYLKQLENKDLSLAHSMIPLGSCTMKLNATSEMIPLSWREFGDIHPFAPRSQWLGYEHLFRELERDLAELTGYDAVSLQPNSGANGEYAGLRCIAEYHKSRGDAHRNICLIPTSAHGTNPASATMGGFEIQEIPTLPCGSIDISVLKAKADQFKDRLGAIMITYPSTFGVFEEAVREVCDITHENGGLVYLDGANMNAQVGICRPGDYGADVSHLNLHKTFCIPHGGGGPGMGPIGVVARLAPFLPGHCVVEGVGGSQTFGAVAAAPYGSASILPISYAYIKMMGAAGLRRASELAILNANYMRKRLEDHYSILYTNRAGFCAHEFIVDLRPFKAKTRIEAADVAKRLQDFGFHGPTMSWPVPNTLMIEPTESEDQAEMDRFCDAMIAIRQEIAAIEEGTYPMDNNPLVNAPHPATTVMASEWNHPYSRETAAYPLPYVRDSKFWPSTRRVDDVFGDRNLQCSLTDATMRSECPN